MTHTKFIDNYENENTKKTGSKINTVFWVSLVK